MVKCNNIILQIFDVVIRNVIVNKAIRCAAFIIEKIYVILAPRLTHKQAVIVVVIVYYKAIVFLNAQSVRAVLVRNRRIASLRCCKLASVIPREDILPPNDRI